MKTIELAMQNAFLKDKMQRFASKTFQNNPNESENVNRQSFKHLYANFVTFERFQELQR